MLNIKDVHDLIDKCNKQASSLSGEAQELLSTAAALLLAQSRTIEALESNPVKWHSAEERPPIKATDYLVLLRQTIPGMEEACYCHSVECYGVNGWNDCDEETGRHVIAWAELPAIKDGYEKLPNSYNAYVKKGGTE